MKIKVEIQGSPKGYDVAFTSLDRNGNQGNLNQFVLNELEIPLIKLPKTENLKLGVFRIKEPESKCQVIFIVTVSRRRSIDLLKRNFSKALKAFSKEWKNKRIWIPIMGVGTAGIEIKTSFDIIYNEINEVFKGSDLPSEITLSIPSETEKKTVDSISSLVSAWNDFSQEEDEETKKDLENITNKINKQILINKNLFTKKFTDIVNSKTFFYQKARDVLEQLKYYDEQSPGFLSKEELNSITKGQNSSSYKKLKFHWDNRGDIKPRNFEEFLKKEESILVPLYELINKFISYVDKNAFNRRILNDYKDKRCIAKTNVRQHDLINHFLLYALNNFQLIPSRSKNIFNNVIEYLESPQKKLNVVSERHQQLISKKILGKRLSGEDFHFKLKTYFEQFGFLLNNLENETTFYTYILYDSSIRKLWFVEVGAPTKRSRSVDDGSGPPYDDNPDIGNGSTNERVPFHLDQVVEEDKLGREPVAKAFVDLIKNDVFTDKLKHSFMVHLQGKWGVGKSSFLNFIKKNLNAGDEKWIIIDYNAWQNQHISPPWWTLIDQIYRQSKSELPRWYRWGLRRKETLRRIWWYSGWEKIFALALTSICILLIIYFGNDIIKELGKMPDASNKVSNDVKGLNVNIFGKLFLTLGSVIGVIYSFSNFISTPFFIKSSKEAKSFVLRAADPMSNIIRHYSGLVDNINSKKKKRQLAIFIDDIDRCNKEFIVELLEGVQTLFKEKRVLYIVAGDKNWITTSFGNTYKEFSDENEDSNHLGELFLEKAFQLSFRMPNIEESAKKRFWNYILGLTEQDIDETVKKDTFEKLNQEQQIEVKEAIKTTKEDIANPEFMQNLEDKFNLTHDSVSDIIIEEKNSDKEELKHLLKDYHDIIDPNPRSIIRLANNYAMTRSTIIAERKKVPADKIFRWLVIEDILPGIKHLSSMEQIVDYFEKEIPEGKIKVDCTTLLNGNEELEGDSLEMDEIKNIIGL